MRETDGKAMFEKLYKEENGKKAAEDMMLFVNNYSTDIKGFLEGALENKKTIKFFTRIALFWILKLSWQYCNNYYDGRNEYSVKTGAKLQEVLEKEIDELKTKYTGSVINETDYVEGYTMYNEPVPFEILFVEKASRSHRTLQQSFSRIVFEFLTKIEKFNKKIKKEIEGDFYKTPLI